jgi:hypothetical protein
MLRAGIWMGAGTHRPLARNSTAPVAYSNSSADQITDYNLNVSEEVADEEVADEEVADEEVA